MLAPGPKEIGVPDTVITPPGVRVSPAMTKAEELPAVIVESSNERTRSCPTGVAVVIAYRKFCVLLPMTATLASEASEIGVPATVI